ncbi:hypothetical protein CRUP_033974 [Coryphaenoides rupestris]|nr:hypothetical protein CRUP_033974 [Coryphaenoides rupestris]
MSSENLDSDTQIEYEDEKQDSQEKNGSPIKSEEAKLKAKYPSLGQKPGGSDFLMKRLQKGVATHPPTRVFSDVTAASAASRSGCRVFVSAGIAVVARKD